MKDMALKMGVASSTLSSVERGKRKIPVEWAETISRNYNLSEQQVKELTNMLIVDSLTEREKRVLDSAVSAIYFDDSSDYIRGLWGVVSELVGGEVVRNEGFCIKVLFEALQENE